MNGFTCEKHRFHNPVRGTCPYCLDEERDPDPHDQDLGGPPHPHPEPTLVHWYPLNGSVETACKLPAGAPGNTSGECVTCPTCANVFHHVSQAAWGAWGGASADPDPHDSELGGPPPSRVPGPEEHLADPIGAAARESDRRWWANRPDGTQTSRPGQPQRMTISEKNRMLLVFWDGLGDPDDVLRGRFDQLQEHFTAETAHFEATEAKLKQNQNAARQAGYVKGHAKAMRQCRDILNAEAWHAARAAVGSGGGRDEGQAARDGALAALNVVRSKLRCAQDAPDDDEGPMTTVADVVTMIEAKRDLYLEHAYHGRGKDMGEHAATLGDILDAITELSRPHHPTPKAPE